MKRIIVKTCFGRDVLVPVENILFIIEDSDPDCSSLKTTIEFINGKELFLETTIWNISKQLASIEAVDAFRNRDKNK